MTGLAILIALYLSLKGKAKVWDPVSEARLVNLHPQVEAAARRLLAGAELQGIQLRITSGFRSYSEQAQIYAKGRTAPGKIVTHARPGQSYHNFGLAFDVVPMINGQPDWNSPHWQKIGEMGKAQGLTWGGDWKWKDWGHFQLDTGRSSAEWKALFETAGLPWINSRSLAGVGRPKQTPWFEPYTASSGQTRTAYKRHAQAKRGVYLIRSKASQEILYVGSSRSQLQKTIYRHFQSWIDDQYRATFERDQVEIQVVEMQSASDEDISAAECELIQIHQPSYNINRCEDFGEYVEVKDDLPEVLTEEDLPF